MKLPRRTHNASLPDARLVCGYEIKKLPTGAYLEALEKVQNLPVDVLTACFPGQDLNGVLNTLKTLDEHALVRLITGLLSTGAPYVLMLLSHFTGIPEETLRDDPKIGLSGLVEIVKALWEVNDLGNVLAAAMSALPSLTKPGFKA